VCRVEPKRAGGLIEVPGSARYTLRWSVETDGGTLGCLNCFVGGKNLFPCVKFAPEIEFGLRMCMGLVITFRFGEDAVRILPPAGKPPVCVTEY